MIQERRDSRVELGRTGMYISPMGVGTWAWGDRLIWGYGRSGYSEVDVREAYQVSLEAGINFFDTAEIYGTGRSERILGRLAKATDERLVLATKFFPYPWRLFQGQMKSALQGSLRRLGVPRIDLYQIHWPYPPRSPETWVASLAAVAGNGRVGAVGVSNYNLRQMLAAAQILSDRGLTLAANQVEFSLLDRAVERQGVLDACKEAGITLIAYSPLGMGTLTGKYSPDNPPPGMRRRRYSPERLTRIQRLVAALREIGARYGGKTPAQVALNWVIAKGAVPIPGAKNARQAAENAGALHWRLSPADVEALDRISEEIQDER